MRNFIFGYLVGSFVAGFALSFLSSYAHTIQQGTIKAVYATGKAPGQVDKVPPVKYSA